VFDGLVKDYGPSLRSGLLPFRGVHRPERGPCIPLVAGDSGLPVSRPLRGIRPSNPGHHRAGGRLRLLQGNGSFRRTRSRMRNISWFGFPFVWVMTTGTGPSTRRLGAPYLSSRTRMALAGPSPNLVRTPPISSRLFRMQNLISDPSIVRTTPGPQATLLRFPLESLGPVQL